MSEGVVEVSGGNLVIIDFVEHLTVVVEVRSIGV